MKLPLAYCVRKRGSHRPLKIEKVASWPSPTTTKQVQQFLGLAGYCRWVIPDFAEISHPLHCLTEQNAHFKWSGESQKTFAMLITCLISASVLAYHDFSKPLMLDTNTSDTGINADLSQLDESGRERVTNRSEDIASPRENFSQWLSPPNISDIS